MYPNNSTRGNTHQYKSFCSQKPSSIIDLLLLLLDCNRLLKSVTAKFSCMMHNNTIWVFYLLVCNGILCVCVNAGINVCILTVHVNVVMGGQLDDHLLFWQPIISITLCYCTAYLLFAYLDGNKI